MVRRELRGSSARRFRRLASAEGAEPQDGIGPAVNEVVLVESLIESDRTARLRCGPLEPAARAELRCVGGVPSHREPVYPTGTCGPHPFTVTWNVLSAAPTSAS